MTTRGKLYQKKSYIEIVPNLKFLTKNSLLLNFWSIWRRLYDITRYVSHIKSKSRPQNTITAYRVHKCSNILTVLIIFKMKNILPKLSNTTTCIKNAFDVCLQRSFLDNTLEKKSLASVAQAFQVFSQEICILVSQNSLSNFFFDDPLHYRF
jgi:hypothetical protein